MTWLTRLIDRARDLIAGPAHRDTRSIDRTRAALDAITTITRRGNR